MKELIGLLLFLLFNFGDDRLCEEIRDVILAECPLPLVTTTTTTTIQPEYCGRISMEEVSELLAPLYREEWHVEFLWQYEFKLVSIDSVKEWLDCNRIPNLGHLEATCGDYCRIMQGRLSEWSPHSAFGIVWLVWEENGKKLSHCKNIFIDCDRRVWFLEPQGNVISDTDVPAFFILMETL